jgi:predicted dehydrogenase
MPFGYGLIGAGSFGQFCLEQYRQMNDVKIIAIADANRDAAAEAAEKQGVEAAGVDEMLARDDVDLVHIATPPFTHRDLAVRALQHGKHVLCEKPLAVTADDAEAMIAEAGRAKRLLAVNLIMRYNPICEAVRLVMSERLLGQPLHGFFENYAKDEQLSPDHWFWDRGKSGGIFVEHGVHFFDLFESWLGRGEVVAAQQVTRPGKGFVEQVQATIRYTAGDGGSVYVNHYHGFTQTQRMDRQEMRVLCERGSIRLHEWVPTSLEIDAMLPRDAVDRLLEVLPDARIVAEDTFEGDARKVLARHKRYEADGRYKITATSGMDKPSLYGHVVRALLTDQIAVTRDATHQRRISETNGYESLLTAIRAQALADAST